MSGRVVCICGGMSVFVGVCEYGGVCVVLGVGMWVCVICAVELSLASLQVSRPVPLFLYRSFQAQWLGGNGISQCSYLPLTV